MNSDCINFEEISSVKITGLLSKQHLLCYNNEVQEVLFDDKAMTKRKPWISTRVIDKADISVRETPLLPSFHPRKALLHLLLTDRIDEDGDEDEEEQRERCQGWQ